MALSNNDVFKKLRVAHKLTNDDIVDICALVDFKVTKSELGAIFRREDHPKYMECGDQFLRNFLDGLIIHLRGPMPSKNEAAPKKPFHPNKFKTNKPKSAKSKSDKPFKSYPSKSSSKPPFKSKDKK